MKLLLLVEGMTMNGRKMILSGIISLIAIWLGACSVSLEEQAHEASGAVQFQSGEHVQEETQITLNKSSLDILEATEISLNTSGKELSDLLHVDCYIEKGKVDVKAGAYTEISECARNEKDIFYVKSYGKEGAQFYYLNQIYHYDADQKEDVLLYETSDAVWLNEFFANNTYLYWVEYVYVEEKGNYDYNVMQYNLSTEEIACIASRNEAESDEICLAVSNEYVTWYDGYQNENIKIIIYDVARQEIQSIQDATIQRYMPYERLNIVDGGITFFSQDAEEKVYINRYNLETQKTDILLLGNKNDFDQLAACFSNEEFIGWLTEYSYGTYYFYNIKSGELYSLSQSDDMRIFSGWLSKYFYVNDSVSGRVYAYDFESGETYYQNIEQGSALSLRPYGENLLYMKVVGDENVELLTVRILL